MRTLQFSEGGFPLTNDRLEAMQKAWTELKPMLGLMGSGIKFTYQNNSYGIVDGEIYLIDGASTGANYTVDTVSVNVTYADGTSKLFETVKVLKPAAAGTVTLSDIAGNKTLAAAWTKLTSHDTTLSSHTTQIAQINAVIEQISGTVEIDTRHNMPKGGIIMWGGSIDFQQTGFTTANAFVTSSGIPYGYIPAGNIKYNNVPQTVINSWNSYLAALGVTQRLSWTSGQTEIKFSEVCGVNMSDKFVIGASSDDKRGAWKAADGTECDGVLKLSVDNMPEHQHTVDDIYLVDGTTRAMNGLTGSKSISHGSGTLTTPDGLNEDSSNIKGAYYTHGTYKTGAGVPIDMKKVLPSYGVYYLIKMI